jgi:hypothetical protein
MVAHLWLMDQDISGNTIVNILQNNSHQQFQVDWLNFDGMVVHSLEAKKSQFLAPCRNLLEWYL